MQPSPYFFLSIFFIHRCSGVRSLLPDGRPPLAEAPEKSLKQPWPNKRIVGLNPGPAPLTSGKSESRGTEIRSFF